MRNPVLRAGRAEDGVRDNSCHNKGGRRCVNGSRSWRGDGSPKMRWNNDGDAANAGVDPELALARF